ncbi:MAG: glycosyltransferase family 2 protein [Candidatus Gastranaerophilales bacterium]|nr:glycosyltransferase family 2 protein [Candidatus Gastranaerophilales bacterium]
MSYKEELEVILITYNREKYLQKTFEQIFADDSPIKYLPITILNNKSTDGTSDLIEEYREKFPNIKHIIHNRNIGGNANIARAFEMATARYVWVLCDDDTYDWSNWNEVQQAIDDNYDLIVVANYLNPKENKVNLIKQLTFVPAAIYKTEHITDTSMINANYNISTMFPQMGIFAKYLNDNLNIYICKNWAVKMIDNLEDASYTRGCVNNNLKHPYMTNCYWQFGFVNAMQVFKNKKLKEELVENINLENHKGVDGYMHMFDLNQKHCNGTLKNLTDLFCVLNEKQKKEFFEALIKFYGSKLVVDLIIKTLQLLNLKKIKLICEKDYEIEQTANSMLKKQTFLNELLSYIAPTIRFEKTPEALYIHFFKLFKTRIKNNTIKHIKECSTIRFEKTPEALYIHFFKLFKTRIKLKKKQELS